MSEKPIGIFDSGVGGLTVVREVIKHLPYESIIYFGDTLHFPYGDKSEEELKLFAFKTVEFLQKEGVKLVVIACNSASSAALEDAQRKFDLPIIGVIEPGARAAVLATRNRRIGVIGTVRTIESGAYLKTLRVLDAGAKVYMKACPPFAGLVENGDIDSPHAKEIVRKYLLPLVDAQVDTLILGCTHYPLLKKVISEAMGEGVKLIDSAEEVALEVKETLLRKGILKKEKTQPFYRFISTSNTQKFLGLGKRFLGSEIKEVEEVKLDW